MLDTLYKYAKFQYECGNYSGAAEYLYFYRVLVSSHFKPAFSGVWTYNNSCANMESCQVGDIDICLHTGSW